MESIAETEVQDLIGSIWGSVFGLEAELVENSSLSEESLTGVVHITGDWEGSVILQCNQSLSRVVATKMFGVPLEDVVEEDMHDVICELANMTGGGIKAVLSGSSLLSLPMVIEGSDYRVAVRGCELDSRFAFECGDEAFVIELLRRSERPAASARGSQP